MNGVGTTLIEALRQGDDTIGFEISPYAALACQVKADAGRYDVAALDGLVARFEACGEAAYQARFRTPGGVPQSRATVHPLSYLDHAHRTNPAAPTCSSPRRRTSTTITTSASHALRGRAREEGVWPVKSTKGDKEDD